MNLKDKTLWQRNAAAIGGMVLFAAGINFFIVPARLYNGGGPVAVSLVSARSYEPY